MPISTDSLNNRLYKLLKVRGFDPISMDSKGQATPVPDDAEVFKFTFKQDGEARGKAWITIDSNNQVKVYYNDDIANSEGAETNVQGIDNSWTGFLQQLKMWAQRRQLNFDTQNQDHLSGDMAQRAHMKNEENIQEGSYKTNTGKLPGAHQEKQQAVLNKKLADKKANFVQQGAKVGKGKEMTAHGRIVNKAKGPDMSNNGVGGLGEAAKWRQGYSASGHPPGYKHKSGEVGPLGGTFHDVPDGYDGETTRVPVQKHRDEPDQLSGRHLHKLKNNGTPYTAKNAQRNLKNAITQSKGKHGPVGALPESAKKTPGIALSKAYKKDFDGKYPKAKDSDEFDPTAKIQKEVSKDATDYQRKLAAKKKVDGKVIRNNQDKWLRMQKNVTNEAKTMTDQEKQEWKTGGPESMVSKKYRMKFDANGKKIKNAEDDGKRGIGPTGLTRTRRADAARRKTDEANAFKKGDNVRIHAHDEKGYLPARSPKGTVQGRKDGKYQVTQKSNNKAHQLGRNQMVKVDEAYYPMGKSASYNDNIPTIKIVLQHSRQIQEGEQRYRNVARIFLENEQGERILAPTIRPGIAQVYARHLAEGGNPHDERWNHIGSLVEEYKQMAGFVRAVRGNQFNESAQQLVNEGINHYTSLRETLGKMRGTRGYTAYFESWTPTLMETEDGENTLNELFVQETLDPRIESVMPILSRLHKKVSEMSEVTALDEWASGITEEAIGASSGPKDGWFVVSKNTREPVEGPFGSKDEAEATGYDAASYTFSYGHVDNRERFQQSAEGMMEGQSVGDISINNGTITKQGKRIGQVMQDLKHGYHPAVLLSLDNGFKKWYELDTPELIDVIFKDVSSQDAGVSEGYNTGEENRDQFEDVQDWAQAVKDAGGDVVKGRSGYVANGWDGEIGEWDAATNQGWLVSKFSEGVGEEVTGDIIEEDYVTRLKREAQVSRKEEARQIKAELAKNPTGPDSGWMKNRLAQLMKDIAKFSEGMVPENKTVDRLLRKFVPGQANKQITNRIKDNQFTQGVFLDTPKDEIDDLGHQEIAQSKRNIRRLNKLLPEESVPNAPVATFENFSEFKEAVAQRGYTIEADDGDAENGPSAYDPYDSQLVLNSDGDHVGMWFHTSETDAQGIIFANPDDFQAWENETDTGTEDDYDDSMDGDHDSAMASAGMGTDEDYGSAEDMYESEPIDEDEGIASNNPQGIPESKEKDKCIQCDGTGEGRTADEKCSVCKGTGVHFRTDTSHDWDDGDPKWDSDRTGRTDEGADLAAILRLSGLPKSVLENTKPVKKKLNEANAQDLVYKQMAADNKAKIAQMRGPSLKQQMAAMPKAAAAPKLTLNDVWRQVEHVVGQIYPDGDPIDWMGPWLKKKGFAEHQIGSIIERAAKKNGYNDMYDYWNQLKDQLDADLGEGKFGNAALAGAIALGGTIGYTAANKDKADNSTSANYPMTKQERRYNVGKLYKDRVTGKMHPAPTKGTSDK